MRKECRARLAWRALLFVSSACLPPAARRYFLKKLLGYEIHQSAKLSRLCLVVADHVVVDSGAAIGVGSIIKCVGLVLSEHAIVGRNNRVYSPAAIRPIDTTESGYLRLERHSALTHGHLLDVSGGIRIGEYATVAGHGSQLLCHSIDLRSSTQISRRIEIGAYAFVGTRSVLLGGSALPERSVLGAGSVLRESYTVGLTLFSGVPATAIRSLEPGEYGYMTRVEGVVR